MEGEILRQLIHFSGIFLVFIAKFFDPSHSLFISATGFLFFVFLHIIKKYNFRLLKVIVDFADKFERKNCNYEGAIYFFFSSMIIFLIFPVEIASIAIFVLCVYDSLATLSGKFLGKHRIFSEKSIEGIICGFIFTVIFGSFLFPFPKIFLATIIGVFAELFPKINDNLSIPFSIAIIFRVLNFS